MVNGHAEIVADQALDGKWIVADQLKLPEGLEGDVEQGCQKLTMFKAVPMSMGEENHYMLLPFAEITFNDLLEVVAKSWGINETEDC